MTDKPSLFRLEYLADMISKMNKMSVSFQEKQFTLYVANDKNSRLYVKINILKIFTPNHELGSFPNVYLKTFLK